MEPNIYALLTAAVGGAIVKTIDVIVGGARAWRDRKKENTSELDDARASRLTWRDYAYLLRHLLYRHGVEPPPEPPDPYDP